MAPPPLVPGAEIELGDDRIVGKRGGGAFVAQQSLDQDHGAVGDGERCLHVLLDQDDGDAGFVDRLQLRKTSATILGDSPADGSSRISTDGSTISARATASIWRWPPDSWPALSDGRAARSGNIA